MRKTTLYNPLIYSNIVNKSIKFLQLIDFAIDKHVEMTPNKRESFYNNFPYSTSQVSKILNPNDDTKQLKFIDFITLLDNLYPEPKRLILDHLASMYDGVFLSNTDLQQNNKTIEQTLLKITAETGKLSNKFLEAIEDDNINDIEEKELEQIVYALRTTLRIFENKIKS